MGVRYEVDPRYPALFRETGGKRMWCVQHGGGGRYFGTFDEALGYTLKKMGKKPKRMEK